MESTRSTTIYVRVTYTPTYPTRDVSRYPRYVDMRYTYGGGCTFTSHVLVVPPSIIGTGLRISYLLKFGTFISPSVTVANY